MDCRVREARQEDLRQLLALYLDLHETQIPPDSDRLLDTWHKILRDPDHHLIVCEVKRKIVSSCVCVVIPNLTRNVRPYALVENVVTHRDYRGRGYGSQCLEYARNVAVASGCYKMMLLTGAKDAATLAFYEKAGYNSTDKTAFIQWI